MPWPTKSSLQPFYFNCVYMCGFLQEGHAYERQKKSLDSLDWLIDLLIYLFIYFCFCLFAVLLCADVETNKSILKIYWFVYFLSPGTPEGQGLFCRTWELWGNCKVPVGEPLAMDFISMSWCLSVCSQTFKHSDAHRSCDISINTRTRELRMTDWLEVV